MVWVEVIEKRYNERYDYVSSELVNRYNEKFDNFVKFLKKHESLISGINVLHEWTSPRIGINMDGVVRDDSPKNTVGIRIVAECTVKQIGKLEKELDMKLR